MIDISHASIFTEGLDHPEGIAIHPDGTIWAGGEAGQIYRISADGNQVDVVANTGGFILGLAFSPRAEWLAACDLANHCVWHIDPTSHDCVKLISEVEGKPLKIPNYISFDDQGGFFLSESGDFRKVNGSVAYVDPNGSATWWHKGPFNFANGLALWDGWLYIVCSFLPGVERVRILDDGTAGEREVFCKLPQTVPDGLAFDANGALYISCYAPNRIYQVNIDRECAIWIDDWEAHTLSNPTNIAFGGEHHDQLFSTNLGRWHITRIDIDVAGQLLPSHR